jgi:hypothetical protein
MGLFDVIHMRRDGDRARLRFASSVFDGGRSVGCRLEGFYELAVAIGFPEHSGPVENRISPDVSGDERNQHLACSIQG